MTDLVKYIEAVKLKGASDAFIVQLLKQRGWPEKKVYQEFAGYYDGLTGVTAPAHGAGAEAAKDAFLYLLSFATLGTWTFALGSLLFTFIDLWFPIPAYRGAANRYGVSNEMASIIVALPIYAWVLRLLGRELERHPEKARSGVRKWLSYLALFVAAACVIGDLITFLAFFLRGDLTARFVLKVLTVLVIAGGVFWFYLNWLKEEGHEQES